MMGHIKWVGAVLFVLGTALGCSKGEAPAAPEAAPESEARVTEPTVVAPEAADTAAPAQQHWVIGMSQCNLGEPWRGQMNADIAKAAEGHPELEVIFKDAQNDTLKQRAHIEEFTSQGVDLLIVSPKEAAPLTPPIAAAFKAGIPVIVLDRAVIGEDFTVFIGADNNLIGEAAGRWLAARLPGGGKVVELKGLMTSIPGQDRSNGFHKGIEGSPLEIIFDADMQWLEPNARKEMESALARFDHIDAVYAHNDPGARGAWLAAKAAGREKEMLFIGIDGLPQEGQQYVAEEVLSATFLYPTGGAEAIDTALKILNGAQVEKHIVLPTKIFTKDNVAAGGLGLASPEEAAKVAAGG